MNRWPNIDISIPNIPGFYLLFRAWSHWRALYGAKHLDFLVKQNLIDPKPSYLLDKCYTAGLEARNPNSGWSGKSPDPKIIVDADIVDAKLFLKEQMMGQKHEFILLDQHSGQMISSAFEVPQMCVEVERAVEQVEKVLKTEEQDDENREKS